MTMIGSTGFPSDHAVAASIEANTSVHVEFIPQYYASLDVALFFCRRLATPTYEQKQSPN